MEGAGDSVAKQLDRKLRGEDVLFLHLHICTLLVRFFLKCVCVCVWVHMYVHICAMCMEVRGQHWVSISLQAVSLGSLTPT